MRFACLFFIFSAAVAGAQDTVAVTDRLALANLAPAATFIRDTAGVFAIESFLQQPAPAAFRPVKKEVIAFGITKHVFWVKTALRNATTKTLLLKVGNSALAELDVYETAGPALLQHYHSGSRLPAAQREVQDVDYLFPLQVQPGQATTVYIRVRHFRGTQFHLQAGTETAFYNEAGRRNVEQGIYYGFMLLMILYNLFIYFLLRDTSYLYYVAYVFLMGLLNATVTGYAFQYLWPAWPALNPYEDIVAALVCIAGILFTVNFLNTKKNAPFLHRLLLLLLVAYTAMIGVIAAGNFLAGSVAVEMASLLLVLLFFFTAWRVLKKGYKPAGFFLLAWSLLLVSVIIFVLKDFQVLPYNDFTENSLQLGSAAEALLLSMALANRINVYKQEKLEAQLETLRSLEENRKLITGQNQELEKKVEERTGELKETNKELLTALMNLQDTQAQLVQREKMASLGELIAGIAHEIQNPLNFVNNFAESNNEILADLQQAAKAGNWAEVQLLAGEAGENEQRILHHGKRADSIVKSMLLHSRSGTGKKEPTDINQLANEYLRMSYQGLRAKDGSFYAQHTAIFDDGIGKIEVVAQEIGRVLLNLFNNAFYTVHEKKKLLNRTFEPAVLVRTKRTEDRVEIEVEDNGMGIPEKAAGKIFQPFYTTKPTGVGTGLGLSLSYDIVTKGHGGELKVQTKEGEGTVFKIILPAGAKSLNSNLENA